MSTSTCTVHNITDTSALHDASIIEFPGAFHPARQQPTPGFESAERTSMLPCLRMRGVAMATTRKEALFGAFTFVVAVAALFAYIVLTA